MALAANAAPYFPPRHIQKMEDDLAMLVELWDDGSGRPQPWGWSKAAKWVFRKRGVAENFLPSDAELETWRMLSSRAFAADYLSAFLNQTPEKECVGRNMRFLKSLDELGTYQKTLKELKPVQRTMEDHKTPTSALIFKSPWSSSGRGVFVAESLDDTTRKHLQGFVRHQGGFLVDTYYNNKVLDFALEFKVEDDGAVQFLGFSVFSAGTQGNYGYNLVAPQNELKAIIEQAAQQSLDALLQSHLNLLRQKLAGRYRGFVGIDMMVVSEEGVVRIHPCVEINLRMNMGILALLLEQKADDKVFYLRLRERLPFEDFPFADFDCLRSCMRSSMRVPLTPSREVGFQASVGNGRLMLTSS